MTLNVIDEPLPESAKVVVSFHQRLRPVLSGGGRATLLCGSCGYAVAKRVDVTSIGAVLLRCPKCCRYNSAASIPQ